MEYFGRTLEAEITRTEKFFSCVMFIGPKRPDKATLLRYISPEYQYVFPEGPDVPDVSVRAGADPWIFLDGFSLPVILGEIQNLPTLFPYIRSRIDTDAGQKGRWFLTGLWDASLMRGVSESMAGCAAVFSACSSPAVVRC